MAHRQSNFGNHKKQDRCAKIMQILVAPVICQISRSNRVMKLPLQNLKRFVYQWFTLDSVE